MLKVFDLREYGKSNKIWDISSVILGVLSLISFLLSKYYDVETPYIILLLLFLYALSLSVLIDKKYNHWKLAEAIILFPVYLIQLSSMDINEPILRRLSLVLIILFSAVYLYLGNSLFAYLWKRNFWNVRYDWNSLSYNSFKRIVIELIIGSLLVIGLHLFNATYFFSQGTFSIDGIHQLVIGILISLLLIYYANSFRRISHSHAGKAEKKEVILMVTGTATMHLFVMFFFFDMLLELYRFTLNGSINIANILMNISFLFVAFKLPYLAKNALINNLLQH